MPDPIEPTVDDNAAAAAAAAPTEPTEPAEPPETPEPEQPDRPEGEPEQTSDDEPAKPDAKPDAKDDKKPEPDPAAAADDEPAPEAYKGITSEQAYNDWLREFDDVSAKLEKGEIDPIDDAPKALKTLAKGMKFVQEGLKRVDSTASAQNTQQNVEAYWRSYERKNPDLGKRGREIYTEELALASAKYKNPLQAQAVATEKWESRVALVRAQAEAKQATGAAAAAALPAKPVTPGGAKITPQAVTRPPAPKPKTTEQKLESGAYGNLARLVS